MGPAAMTIDREGTAHYVNRLLQQYDAGQRSYQQVERFLFIIFPCMTRDRAHDMLRGGVALGVSGGAFIDTQRHPTP